MRDVRVHDNSALSEAVRAGTGVGAPRAFNALTQAKRFDPDGADIRRYAHA
jgi:deoxyribodipyrimidine photolyase